MTAKNRQLSTEYLRVKPVGDDEWTFEYPRLTFEVLDQLVAKELTKSRPRQPKDMRPGYVTYGGADQAYLYWLEYGHHWRKTAGALEFVKAILQKYEG